MEFLKEILDNELYAQLEAKINEYNSSDAGKEKKVKIGNLSSGDYVGKAEYDALSETLKAKETELVTANTLIEETKLKSAVKVALLSARAADADYLAFKLNEKDEKLELDESGNIKGWEDKLQGLKTQFPNMFESGDSNGFKVLGDNRLPGGDDRKATVTREEFLKMGYNDRLKLKQENEQLYKQLTKK